MSHPWKQLRLRQGILTLVLCLYSTIVALAQPTPAVKISAGEGGFGGHLDPGDFFGAALAAIGDLDGDGVTELAVGSPGDDDGGTNKGALWILFLNRDGSVRSYQKISDTEGDFDGL